MKDKELQDCINKVHEYNKTKRLVSIKVNSRVLQVLKNSSTPNKTENWEQDLIDKYCGVYVQLDEEADYPFTPIYNFNDFT